MGTLLSANGMNVYIPGEGWVSPDKGLIPPPGYVWSESKKRFILKSVIEKTDENQSRTLKGEYENRFPEELYSTHPEGPRESEKPAEEDAVFPELERIYPGDNFTLNQMSQIIEKSGDQTLNLSEALFIPANSGDTEQSIANWEDYAVVPREEYERLKNVERKSNVYR